MGVWEYGSMKMKHIYYYSFANYNIGIQILSNTVDKCTQFTHIFGLCLLRNTTTLPYYHTNFEVPLPPKLFL
jgi:hypothetical protein